MKKVTSNDTISDQYQRFVDEKPQTHIFTTLVDALIQLFQKNKPEETPIPDKLSQHIQQIPTDGLSHTTQVIKQYSKILNNCVLHPDTCTSIPDVLKQFEDKECIEDIQNILHAKKTAQEILLNHDHAYMLQLIEHSCSLLKENGVTFDFSSEIRTELTNLFKKIQMINAKLKEPMEFIKLAHALPVMASIITQKMDEEANFEFGRVFKI